MYKKHKKKKKLNKQINDSNNASLTFIWQNRQQITI